MRELKWSNEKKVNQWRRHIEGKRNSGMTVEAYCRRQGIGEWEFYKWQSRLKTKQGVNRLEEKSRFEVVKIENRELVNATTCPLCIQFANGIRVEMKQFPEIRWMKDLLGLLVQG